MGESRVGDREAQTWEGRRVSASRWCGCWFMGMAYGTARGRGVAWKAEVEEGPCLAVLQQADEPSLPTQETGNRETPAPLASPAPPPPRFCLIYCSPLTSLPQADRFRFSYFAALRFPPPPPPPPAHSPVAVHCESRAVLCRKALEHLVVEAQVEHRVHHAGHGHLGAASGEVLANTHACRLIHTCAIEPQVEHRVHHAGHGHLGAASGEVLANTHACRLIHTCAIEPQVEHRVHHAGHGHLGAASGEVLANTHVSRLIHTCVIEPQVEHRVHHAGHRHRSRGQARDMR